MEGITQQIVNYVTDNSSIARFAICLYGEWGSGRTHYCETSLKNTLKNNGLKILRISLFGVKSSEDIYTKLLSAVFRTEGTKAEQLGKEVGKGIFITV